PFLIRQICSFIHNDFSKERPVNVSKYYYRENKETFNRRLVDYIDLIIQVLKNWYPAEHNLLEQIALNKNLTDSTENDLMIEHLFGYNLVTKENGKVYIKVDLIAQYLEERTKVVKIPNSYSEKWYE